MRKLAGRARSRPGWGARSLAFVNRTFIRGIAAVLPIALTVYLLWWISSRAETWLGALFKRLVPEHLYVPGVGLVAGLLAIFAIGLVLHGWLTRSILAWGERVIDRIPLVKTIYRAVKDLMGFFASSDDKERLSKVVLVTLWDDVRLIGFLTREDASELTRRTDDSQSVAVYVPMSYQIGGFLVMVPRAAITPLPLRVEEALRLSVTAGVRAKEEQQRR